REWREPFGEGVLECRHPRALGRRVERAALAPWFDHERPEEPRAGDDRDDAEQQRKARFELKLVAHVLNGLEADQRQEPRERDQRGDRRVLDRGRKARSCCGSGNDGLGCCGGHTFSTSGRPSRPCGRKISTIARMEKAATSL